MNTARMRRSALRVTVEVGQEELVRFPLYERKKRGTNRVMSERVTEVTRAERVKA
jgi:hypothetical protein